MLNIGMGMRGGCASTRAVLKTRRFCAVPDGSNYDVVDIFDGKAGMWSTEKLSFGRSYLSATSLPSQGLALFAGGEGALL